ncbi:MAG: hypothetical protein KDB03_29080, partial [Planctomycetales bacterium]|nr:hypothetical protein [Planctomycetales bacterium]
TGMGFNALPRVGCEEQEWRTRHLRRLALRTRPLTLGPTTPAMCHQSTARYARVVGARDLADDHALRTSKLAGGGARHPPLGGSSDSEGRDSEVL